MCEFNRHGILADVEGLRHLPQRSRPKEDTMLLTRRNLLHLGAAAAMAAAVPSLARAQSYPTRPVRLIVGFPAGGSTDIIARDIASELEKVWGQPVIVDNRGGANGAIAAAQLAKLPADGHTLMMIVPGHVTNPVALPNAGYEAIKDFTPITLVASSPLLIFAHAGYQASDIKTMIALAKEKPNKISYASPGTASINHLSMELMASLTGTKFAHIPYRGGGPALNDVIGGHVPLGVFSIVQVQPLLQAKAIKPLAVTSAKASDLLPNVPSLAEVGVKNYEAEIWFAMIAPSGLPPAIATKINADVNRIVRSPSMQQKIAAQGGRPIGSTRSELMALMQAESTKWAQIIKDAGIRE
jgi:tripartite-type tricarboxylate transporter receptor subunit TctC